MNLKAKEDNIRCSVANITEAVSTIVSHSSNDEFRQKCFSLLKVPNSTGLVSSLSSQLHSIAHQHMGVTLPAATSTLESSKKLSTSSQSASSQQDGQRTPLSQSIGAEGVSFEVHDDFTEFSELDFFEGNNATNSLETSQPAPVGEEAMAGSSITDSFQSVEVLQSTLGEDWFDKVLDSELFFNEN
ncbi:uncharacterized protein LOC110978420 [Acanthaster planci]|uniref:Uncharacterized protein LOC110978420 n=1 Tax=Acanthaster planci TaxID=133434 RepID=A0A8B7Y7A8_ACAPL|nr:uncharacterized protein LOC110978420 [Acanthaster planci]